LLEKNYAEMFGGKMRMNASIMRKTHWVIWKFQQLTELMNQTTVKQKALPGVFQSIQALYYMLYAFLECISFLLYLFMEYFDKHFIIYTVSL